MYGYIGVSFYFARDKLYTYALGFGFGVFK